MNNLYDKVFVIDYSKYKMNKNHYYLTKRNQIIMSCHSFNLLISGDRSNYFELMTNFLKKFFQKSRLQK